MPIWLLLLAGGAVVYYTVVRKKPEQPDPEIGGDTSTPGDVPSPEGPGSSGPGPIDQVFSSDPESPDYMPIISTAGKGFIGSVEAIPLDEPDPENMGSTGQEGEQEIGAGDADHQTEATGMQTVKRLGALGV